MNVDKLLEAESLFLHRYPGGFANEALQQIVKKRHNVGRLSEFAAEVLAKPRFKHTAQVLDDIVKIVSRSSMVSLFEKPRFRDFVNGLGRDDRALLVSAFQRLLHGNQQKGFTDLVDLLGEGQIAKWSLVTICPYQYRPEREVFVKPTTTKNVIRQFELNDLTYRPRPSWDFYDRYRAAIAEMKAVVNPSLAPNNAAFTGFLMMSTAVEQP